ncbi:MAG: ParB/RepB/Spo0J family partition protein [Oscillospiraceae bacterium]
MLDISDESYERVNKAIKEIGNCCDTEEDYQQWEDTAASVIDAFFDELDTDQMIMTCEAFCEYIADKADEDMNFAKGLKAALERCLSNMLDHIAYHSFGRHEEKIQLRRAIENSLCEIREMSLENIETAAENDASAVMDIPIEMLVHYHSHPFVLYSGERLDDMVNSVKKNGILTPIIVRTLPDGRYEILAGHNRANAAKLAGLSKVPAVVKNGISDEEADIYVIETNLMQRGFKDLLVSEQAAVVALRHSKLFDEKKQKAISDELNQLENKTSKLAAVGQEYDLSKNTIARLIRVHKLLTVCDKYKLSVDTRRVSIGAAVELSYLSANALDILFELSLNKVYMDDKFCSVVNIDIRHAKKLREHFKDFDGEFELGKKILKGIYYYNGAPKKLKPIKLDPDVRSKYFSDDKSASYVNDTIDKALGLYFYSTFQRIK